MVFLKTRPITPSELMPVFAPQDLINGIHGSLAADQGLVEVKNGKGSCGAYIYSIVKTAKEPAGVQYCLVLHLCDDDGAVEIVGFFEEVGSTGGRETAVFEMSLRSGAVKSSDITRWQYDPYDPGRKEGFLMNISERAEYDELFKEHPLSKLRGLVSMIVG